MPGQRRRPLHRQPRQREQFRHAGEPHQARRSRRRGAGRRVLPARRRRRQGDLAVRRRGRQQRRTCYCSDEWTNTISVFDTERQVPCASGARPAAATANCCARRGSRSRRTATSSSSTAATTGCRCSRPRASWSRSAARPASGDGEFNQPWGITLDKDGNIYVADWKNHRVQKLSPQGKFLMSIGAYGEVAASGRCLRRDLSRAVRLQPADRPTYPKAGLLNHPTDVAVDPRRRHLRHRLGQPPGLHLRGRRHAADQSDRRRAGVVEVGPAERRCQSGHDEGVSPGAEPRSRCTGSASRPRSTSIRRPTRSSWPTASATGCRSTRRCATTRTSRRTCRFQHRPRRGRARTGCALFRWPFPQTHRSTLPARRCPCPSPSSPLYTRPSSRAPGPVGHARPRAPARTAGRPTRRRPKCPR